MSKEMVISANPHETRVALLEEGQLCEYYVEREKEFALVGSIYKGRVTRVLPGMQSAFVEIGLDSDAFLYVSDFLESIEEFDDHVATTADEKVHKTEEQGGRAFTEGATSSPAMEPLDVESDPPQPGAGAAYGDNQYEQQPREGAAFAAAPSANTTPALPGSFRAPGSGSQDRGGRGPRPFGSRSREGGRDSRGGRGGGRRGGGGDRFNRRGGHGGPSRSGSGGGSGRFGRDLPSSKYASSRPYEDHSSEPAPPSDGSTPIILPGESLAKYREKPPVSPDMASPEAASTGVASANAFEQAAPSMPSGIEQSPWQASAPQSTPEPTPDVARESIAESSSQESPAPRVFEARIEPPRRSSAFTPSRSSVVSGGLEPLPGESLAKWRTAEPAAPPSPVPPPPLIDEPSFPRADARAASLFEPASQRAERETQGADVEDDPADNLHDAHSAHNEAIGSEASHASHSIDGLSDEEAQIVAEHVAEAQSEITERDGDHQIFSPRSGAEIGEESHEHEERISPQEEREIEAEQRDLDEEEADAEAEGMMAPASEGNDSETEHGNELAADTASPSGESSPADQQPSRATVRDNFRARMQQPGRRGGRDRDRGRRDDRNRRPHHGGSSHGGPHRSQPRRPQLISEMLKQGQEIIVQIAKEPLGKKGARITSHVALPGRFLVYMPTLDHTGVSRKIASAEERSRLRHLVNDAKGAAGGGFIVRTAAASAPPEDVRTDVEFLTRTWSEIKARSEQRKAPAILHRDLNLIERILRDFITPEFGAIWVDSEEEYTKVIDFMSRFQPALVNRVKLYTKSTPVFEEFGIQQEIDKGLKPKVWLKSGGYIVINHTEALVAIDVNTGKFVGKGSTRLEDTIVRTNLEAVKEIVRQMRLRDLGGIIIIDFIDMEERRNRDKVTAALEDALRADRAPSKMLRFNEFGLIAITRKRTKQALERTLCQPCPYCTGSGMVKSIPTLCYEIQLEAKKMAPELDSGSLTMRVHPEIAKALKTREASLVEELERWTKKSVIIQSDPTLHWEQYDIY
jgi:Rne/Rng family ribonuclease